MSTTPGSDRLGTVAGLGKLALACALIGTLPGYSQLPTGERLYEKAPPDVNLQKATFAGVGSCIRCHEKPGKPYTTDYVQLTEYLHFRRS